MFLWRRHRLPAQLRPALEAGERVLAWARVAAHATPAGVVVASNRGLYLPDPPPRLGWHQIHTARWTGSHLVVVPAEVVQERDGYQVAVDGPQRSWELADPGELPRVVRERVVASVSHTSHHTLPGDGGVRVVGRRVSGVDGLTWAVRYDPGTDPDAAGVAEATAEIVRFHAAPVRDL